jgi:hypothetical protein
MLFKGSEARKVCTDDASFTKTALVATWMWNQKELGTRGIVSGACPSLITGQNRGNGHGFTTVISAPQHHRVTG